MSSQAKFEPGDLVYNHFFEGRPPILCIVVGKRLAGFTDIHYPIPCWVYQIEPPLPREVSEHLLVLVCGIKPTGEK